MKIIKKQPLRPCGRSDEKRQAAKDAIREAYANGPQKEVQIIPAKKIWLQVWKRKNSVSVPIIESPELWPFIKETADGAEGQPPAEDNSLTGEEIVMVNEYFASMRKDARGGWIGSTVVNCFFTSYYDRPEDIDLNQFLLYFPVDVGAEPVGQDEFDALIRHEKWHISREITMEDMPIPIHRIPAENVERALRQYAGIGLEDLSGVGFECVIYLEGYEAFYNFTSDFGPGQFQCLRGEVEGDVVRLYSQAAPHKETYYMPSEVEVTLQKRDGAYYIVSHRIVTDGNT